MLEFIQHCFNGLIIGGAYALIGVGMTMILGIMRVINFAHGEFYMLGAYLCYSMVTLMGINFFLAFPIAVLLMAFVGCTVEQVVLRPLRGRELNTNMMAMIGVSIAFSNLALLVWGAVPQAIPQPFPDASINIFGLSFTPFRVFICATAMLVIIGVHLFIQRTMPGKSMRASFQDMEMASMLGVRVNRVFPLTFGLGAAMAAVSGIMLGILFSLKPTMGEFAVSRAFAVVILGGMGSFPGAILGGLILGLSENLAAAYISSGFKDAIAFMLIVFILVFKPTGLIAVNVNKK